MVPDDFDIKTWDEMAQSWKKTAESIRTAKRLVNGIIQGQKEIPTDPIEARKRVEKIKEALAIKHQLEKDQDFIREYNKSHPRKQRKTLLQHLVKKMKKG